MPIETDTITAPSHWASALINGDESSFDYYNDAEDRADYERFCAWLAEHRWEVVDCEGEGYFKHSPHVPGVGTMLSGDVLDYTVLRHT